MSCHLDSRPSFPALLTPVSKGSYKPQGMAKAGSIEVDRVAPRRIERLGSGSLLSSRERGSIGSGR
jgi:hypothetical protein